MTKHELLFSSRLLFKKKQYDEAIAIYREKQPLKKPSGKKRARSSTNAPDAAGAASAKEADPLPSIGGSASEHTHESYPQDWFVAPNNGFPGGNGPNFDEESYLQGQGGNLKSEDAFLAAPTSPLTYPWSPQMPMQIQTTAAGGFSNNQQQQETAHSAALRSPQYGNTHSTAFHHNQLLQAQRHHPQRSAHDDAHPSNIFHNQSQSMLNIANTAQGPLTQDYAGPFMPLINSQASPDATPMSSPRHSGAREQQIFGMDQFPPNLPLQESMISSSVHNRPYFPPNIPIPTITPRQERINTPRNPIESLHLTPQPHHSYHVPLSNLPQQQQPIASDTTRMLQIQQRDSDSALERDIGHVRYLEEMSSSMTTGTQLFGGSTPSNLTRGGGEAARSIDHQFDSTVLELFTTMPPSNQSRSNNQETKESGDRDPTVYNREQG